MTDSSLSCCRSLGRKTDVFQLLLNTPDHIFVEFFLLLLGRVTKTLLAALVPAARTYLLMVLERTLTSMAGPSYMDSDLLAMAQGQGVHLFSVARIAVRIFVEFGSVSG